MPTGPKSGMSRARETRMPLDVVAPQTLPVDAAAFHGVPRHVLTRHVLAGLAPALRRAVIAVELEDGGRFVNLGMHFERVFWRIAWRLPGLPEMAGVIPIRQGEIVA
jgi:hypothetical protein